MAPLQPHWQQPSHPAIQQVLYAPAEGEGDGEDAFTTKSVSRVHLPPFALFARLDTPPCTPASAPTYATVQVGRDQHINLNSDLLYINHSCEPSLHFDTASRCIWVGPRGLRPDDELTFFYPSTEWDMAQSFSCLCGTPSCLGLISGARSLSRDQLAGRWLNGHIWTLLEEQEQQQQQKQQQTGSGCKKKLANGHPLANGYVSGASADDVTAANGSTRRGPTSRELSGEMGGDTLYS